MQDNAYPYLARAFHEAWHGRITARLPVGFERDAQARDHVEAWLATHPGTFHDPRPVTGGKRCLVLAPGPTLEHVAPGILAASRSTVTIAVDGAARFLLERGLHVDVVVSDLDGMGPAGIDELLERGTTAFIHVHGDNIDQVHAFLARHENSQAPSLPVVFTTQDQPTSRVANLGGFTDGDRAIFVAIAAGFTCIMLVSMDLNRDTIGTYSKRDTGGRRLDEHPLKRDKLAIATDVLWWLSTRLPAGVEVKTVNMEQPLPMFSNTWL